VTVRPFALATALVLFVTGCAHRNARPGATSTAGGAHQALAVSGFLPAVLFVPEGPGQHPLVVAAHGAGEFPEESCEEWTELTRRRAVVLCLRGARTDNRHSSGYYYANHHVLGLEFRAALAALRARTDVPIAATGHLYTGFSQGAIMGAIMIVDHARDFPNLVLVEGGFQYWNVARARKFARNGGRRVLVVCGTTWCSNGSADLVTWLRRARVDARLEYVPGAGHTSSGPVRERTRAALPWVMGGVLQ
jgi:predicted esterase